MNFLSFILWAMLALQCLAEPEPARVFRYQVGDESIGQQLNNNEKEVEVTEKPNSSSNGRLFGRRFFNKFFGQNQNPPVIIITNPDTTSPTDTSTTGTDFTPPTTTTSFVNPVTTNTVTANTATPIINNPANPANPTLTNAPGNNVVGTSDLRINGRDSKDDSDNVDDEEVVLDDEEVIPNNALSAGDEEFIVSAEDMENTAKAYRVTPANLNLRLRGGQRGQVINVRLPAKYRGYFQNGQRVVLRRAKRTRPGKRRVIRRRKNRRNNRRNKNRRNKNRRNKNRRNKRRRFVIA